MKPEQLEDLLLDNPCEGSEESLKWAICLQTEAIWGQSTLQTFARVKAPKLFEVIEEKKR